MYDGGSYTPVAKLTEEDSYTIVQDYLGTPIQALESRGEVVWDCILDIYGDVLELRGKRDFIPFRFQGQYEVIIGSGITHHIPETTLVRIR